jgi:anthranilate synthase component 1
MITDLVLVFDNVNHKIKIIYNAYVPEVKEAREAYNTAVNKIEDIIKKLRKPVKHYKNNTYKNIRKSKGALKLKSNFKPQDYKKAVKNTKEYIKAGDIIQAVIAQRWKTKLDVDPFDLYRSLRVLNPSPYMFYLNLRTETLVGSSPEVMVRVEEGEVVSRPIAGTRPRGKTEKEDLKLEKELLADPKERAEHIMLVDLARNDLGRISDIGTVKVDEFMIIERYSHVMHIVSNVIAKLSRKKDAFDVLKATFPAGTLSGAPKVRAMEIIEEMEPNRRGAYGGAVGYFSFSGNMDTCITIRTFVIKDNEIYIQAGAGIVADSNPEKEYQESVNKVKALVKAIEVAKSGL